MKHTKSTQGKKAHLAKPHESRARTKQCVLRVRPRGGKSKQLHPEALSGADWSVLLSELRGSPLQIEHPLWLIFRNGRMDLQALIEGKARQVEQRDEEVQP